VLAGSVLAADKTPAPERPVQPERVQTSALPVAANQTLAPGASARRPGVLSNRDFLGRGAEIGGLLAINLWASHRVPVPCRWCDGASTSLTDLNPVDSWSRGVRWQNTTRADTLSSVTMVVAAGGPGAIPYVKALFTGTAPDRQGNTETLIVAEAIAAEMAINGTVKSLAGRERPYGHLLTASQLALQTRDVDASFYSGHAGTAFAGLFAYARVRKMNGEAPAKLWWAAALPAAVLTPYLRMAADKHYLTDVVTGAGVGASVGWFAPRLLHPHMGKEITLVPRAGASGTGVVATIRW
jgi:membrane-associated phospholipid phosphatase